MAQKDQTINQRLLNKLSGKLFSNPNERALFEGSFGAAIPVAVQAAVTIRGEVLESLRAYRRPLKNSPLWLLDDFHPLKSEHGLGSSEMHQSGGIYLLDLASVFEVSVVKALNLKNPKILDLCAAPGGKSIAAWKLCKPDVLIANEVNGQRLKALRSNLVRCGISPVMLIQNDPQRISEAFVNSIDLVLVDAPCSGQSLPLKRISNPGCFHEQNVKMNARRQKRILGCAAECVKDGGYLVYSTCTFSLEENEKMVEWFLKSFHDYSAVQIPSHLEFQSELSLHPCYRLWPQAGLGTGGFVAVFQRALEADHAEVFETASLNVLFREGEK